MQSIKLYYFEILFLKKKLPRYLLNRLKRFFCFLFLFLFFYIKKQYELYLEKKREREFFFIKTCSYICHHLRFVRGPYESWFLAWIIIYLSPHSLLRFGFLEIRSHQTTGKKVIHL